MPPLSLRPFPRPFPRLAIFDLDGTLVDSLDDITGAMNAALAERDQPPLESPQVRAMVGDGALVLATRVLEVRDGAGLSAPALMARFLHHYETQPDHRSQLYPGAREALDALEAAGVALALCTNKPTRPTAMVLEALGIAGRFRQEVCGDTFDFRKPDPRMLTAITEAQGFAPEAAILVGDSEVDAATAEAAGVPFILMTYGYHRGGPRRALAELPALADLPRALGLA